MRITLADPKLIRESIAIISDLVTEAKFKVTSNGLELVATDPINVCMVIFKLLSSSFLEFKAENEEIAINLNYLKQVLKRAKATDTITLETDEGYLHVIFKGRNVRRFSLPLIEIEEGEQKVPQLNFNAKIDTESKLLSDAIADVDVVGESVKFMAEKDKFTISSSGDLGKAKIEIPADEFTTIEVSETQKAKYGIEYLKKMIKASRLSDKVKISFSSDYPLQLDYISQDNLQLTFILAPRMDNE